jgi:hypothetical protein
MDKPNSLRTVKRSASPDLTIAQNKLVTAIVAQRQLEAIFDGIVECARQQRGEKPEWAGFDPGQLPDIVRALAIRGRGLAHATMTALADTGESEDFEREVSHG